MFGALAREVLPRGNGPFPGGSISEHVLRGPARRERGWIPPMPAKPHTTKKTTNVTYTVSYDDYALIYDQYYDPDLYDAAYIMYGTFPTLIMYSTSYLSTVVLRRFPSTPHFSSTH